jgi:hypothetical protein
MTLTENLRVQAVEDPSNNDMKMVVVHGNVVNMAPILT